MIKNIKHEKRAQIITLSKSNISVKDIVELDIWLKLDNAITTKADQLNVIISTEYGSIKFLLSHLYFFILIFNGV